MATSLEPETSQRYVEFHEYVDYQLARTRTSIKTTDLLTALTGAATLLLGYVLLFVVLDHWAIPGGFSYWPRLLLLGFVVLLAAIWIAWKVVWPARKQVTPLFAAHSIERAEPELRSTLLNLVDLRRTSRPVPPDVKLAMERRAALSLSEMDVDEAVDRRGLLHLSYALLAVVLLFCVYTLLSPKSVSASVWRALFPAAKVAVATRTEILSIQPGNAEVIARSELGIKVDLRGERPEQVTLHYTTADRRYVDEPVVLRPVEEGLMQYAGTITGDNGRGILQNLTYHIRAGDARSEDFHVTVLQPPSARVEQVTYEYPAYMELLPRTQPGGQIDTWEGATVSVRAQANMPVRTAIIKFSDTEDTSQKAEELRMTIVNKTTLEATWEAEFRSDGTFPRFYRIVCTNERGDSDPEPALHTITIHPDKPPEVALLSPEGDLQMPANGIVPLVIEARDPDFQLREVTLRTEKDGQPLDAHSPIIFEGRQTSFRGNFDFALAPLELQPGDELTYWIEARDNKQPLFNRRNTARLKIQIIEPVSEEQAQQQLAEHKQQQQEQLKQRELAANQARDDSEAPQAEQGSADQPQNSTSDPQQSADAQQPGDEKQPPESQRTGEGNSNQEPAPGRQQQQSESSESGGQTGKGAGQRQPSDSAGADGAKSDSRSPEQSGAGSENGLRKNGEDDDEALRRLYEKLKEQDQAADQQSDDSSASNKSPSGEPQPSDSTGGNPKPGDNADSGQDPQPATSADKSEGAKSQPQPTGADPNAPPSPGTADPNSSKSTPPDTPGRPGDPATAPKPGDAPGSPPNAPPKSDGASNAEPPPGGDRSGEKPQAADMQNDPATSDEPGENPSTPEGAKSASSPENSDASQPSDTSQQDQAGEPRADESASDKTQPNPNRSGQKADEPSKTGDADSKTGDAKSGERKGRNPPDPQSKNGEPQPPSGNASQPREQQTAPDESVAPETPPADGKSEDSSGGQPGNSQTAPDGKSGSSEKGAGEKGSQSGDSQSDPSKSGKGQSGKGESGKSASGASESGGKSSEAKSPDSPSKNGKADGDKAGDGKADDQGQGGSKPEAGAKPADSKGGKSGESGQNSSKPGGEGSSDAPSQGSAGSGQQPSRGAGAGPPPEGAADGTGSSGAGQGAGVAGPEEANLEFSREAANLVLKNLEDGLSRGDVDQELLEELGWNKTDLEKFAERLKKQLQMEGKGATPAEEARRRQFEEMLKNLDLKSSAKMRTGDAERKGAFEAIDARRVPIPSEFREAFDDYTKSLSKQKN